MLRAGVTTVGVGSAADTLTVPARLQASAAAALGAEFDQKVQLLNDRFSAQMSATAAGGGGGSEHAGGLVLGGALLVVVVVVVVLVLLLLLLLLLQRCDYAKPLPCTSSAAVEATAATPAAQPCPVFAGCEHSFHIYACARACAGTVRSLPTLIEEGAFLANCKHLRCNLSARNDTRIIYQDKLQTV